MEYLFGLKTKNFVLLAWDKNVTAHGIILVKQDEDKSYKLGSKNLMVCIGDGGDPYQFAEYIEKNIQLYKMRNNYEMSPSASAAFTRRTLADGLRQSSPYLVFLMIGGYDDQKGPFLTYMDYLATQFEGNYVMYGYGGQFCYSILDKIYRDDMTEEEAVEALRMCVTEVKKRMAINFTAFGAQIVDKDGTRRLPDVVV